MKTSTPVGRVGHRSAVERYSALAWWTVIACLVAGVFGAIHNQVSYTVSPDYFHAFKFIQFQIAPSLHNRVGAALVGFLAAWWTGIVIGPILTIVCGRVCDHHWPRAVMGPSIVVTVLVTAVVGLVSLSAAYLLVTPSTDLSQLWIPRECRDPVAFTRAGIMHDGSYLGGAIGTICGCIVLIRRGRRWRSDHPGFVSGEGQR
jgi:MFS family permease